MFGEEDVDFDIVYVVLFFNFGGMCKFIVLMLILLGKLILYNLMNGFMVFLFVYL